VAEESKPCCSAGEKKFSLLYFDYSSGGRKKITHYQIPEINDF